MKLSDFLIRGRHLFGFLIPGVMWISIVSLLFFGTDPISFIEGGQNPWLRVSLVLILGYVVGFSLQTIVFTMVAKPLKGQMGLPESLKCLDDQVERILKARLPSGETQWCVDKKLLPGMCKFYVLENSKELKNIIIEKEDDINFLVANIVPGPLLALTWAVRKGNWLDIITVITAAILAAGLLRGRLRSYLERETEEWYETFLVLQLSPSQSEKKGEDK